jgi:hypothetical protein
MGEEFVGIVHPCKLYNILRVGCPFLYIGPSESHVGEIAAQLDGSRPAYLATHGNAGLVVQHILKAFEDRREGNPGPVTEIANSFSRQVLLPRMISLLESQKPEETSLTKPIADGRILAGRSS